MVHGVNRIEHRLPGSIRSFGARLHVV